MEICINKCTTSVVIILFECLNKHSCKNVDQEDALYTSGVSVSVVVTAVTLLSAIIQ